MIASLASTCQTARSHPQLLYTSLWLLISYWTKSSNIVIQSLFLWCMDLILQATNGLLPYRGCYCMISPTSGGEIQGKLQNLISSVFFSISIFTIATDIYIIRSRRAMKENLYYWRLMLDIILGFSSYRIDKLGFLGRDF